jgi:signal transducing adaptor molecule
VKATDENLTSENWELIMTVVDKVSEADSGSKDAVAAMIKRLAHRNANVQLYTLELANALSQNCGPKMHRELASRSFTEAMLRLAGDRNTHQQVKGKIVERMAEWAEMMRGDADLGIMEAAFMRLKTQSMFIHSSIHTSTGVVIG